MGDNEAIYYIINVSANPSAGGDVLGGKKYLHGEEVIVKAIANTNYNFVN